MTQDAQAEPAHKILQLIYEGTAAATGADFFNALVRSVAKAMGTRFAFVAEFAAVKNRVRTLAFWAGDHFAENIEFDLAGTPCEDVLKGEMRFYPDRLSTLFPKDKGLAALGARSYLAIPLTNRKGEVLGHLAIIDDKPMVNGLSGLSVYKIFGARTAAELERKHAELALQKSERRIATILDTATDAIITIDAGHHIALFNQAAEQVFQCASDWAIGQPFDRFLSRRFRALLDEYIHAANRTKKQMWVPEGMTALRANGEEFPIEATISSFEGGDESLYTIILRDVNERKKAEQALRRLQSENLNLREALKRQLRDTEILGESPAMRRVFRNIEMVAGADATVLINGETGTGKELIAKALHEASPRRDKMLVIVNCAALPSELIESELFGHEKGAFTGATAQRKGRFELADGGTLFLDEIGELSLNAQAKLLRALQEQAFERVGGSATLKVNVRVIAATNRDLAKMVAAGTFREDLFYRLNVFPIHVPPLRERPEDIPLLAEYFLQNSARKLGKSVVGMSEPSIRRLKAYAWPGNVRELRNVMDRAAILATAPVVEVEDLAPQLPGMAMPLPADNSLVSVEKEHIVRVLEERGWLIEGRSGAAAQLGMKPSTLRYRMKKLGIEKKAPA